MKRTLTIALTAALFASLFGGLAAAQTVAADPAPTARVVADGGDGPDVASILRRCRHLFGEEELKASVKERCFNLWKRWCDAHPDARYCRRPDVRPHDCRITDRVIDRRCHPHRPVPAPTDRPGDRPSDRPPTRPSDLPADRRLADPPDKADLDIARDRIPSATDRAGNDIHLGARRADL